MAIVETFATPAVVETVDQFGQVGFVETAGAPMAVIAAPCAGQAKVLGGGIQGLQMGGSPAVVEEVGPSIQVAPFGGLAPTYGVAPVAYAAPVSYGAAPVSYGAAPVSYGAAPVSYGAAPLAFGTSSYGTRIAAAPQTYSYGMSAPVAYAAAPMSYSTTYAGGYAQPSPTGASGSVFGSRPFSFSVAEPAGTVNTAEHFAIVNAASVTAEPASVTAEPAVQKVVTTQKKKRGCC